MLGRHLQGLSAACIMPSSLALVKAYWDGAERQRAISCGRWVLGRFGLCGAVRRPDGAERRLALDFLIAAVVSLIGLLMVRGTPGKQGADRKSGYKFDLPACSTFMVAMVALQVFATQGAQVGLDQPRRRSACWPRPWSSGCLLPDRNRQPQRLCQFQPVQELDLHRRDDLEPAAECDGRDHHRGDAAGARGRHDDAQRGRLADASATRSPSSLSSASAKNCCNASVRASRCCGAAHRRSVDSAADARPT